MEVMEGGIKIVDELEKDSFYNWKATAGDAVYRILRNYQKLAEQYFSSVTLRDLLDAQKSDSSEWDDEEIFEIGMMKIPEVSGAL
jgi:DNA-binding IscR family transcriptional regulator